MYFSAVDILNELTKILLIVSQDALSESLSDALPEQRPDPGANEGPYGMADAAESFAHGRADDEIADRFSVEAPDEVSYGPSRLCKKALLGLRTLHWHSYGPDPHLAYCSAVS